jgi:hypothetical protein
MMLRMRVIHHCICSKVNGVSAFLTFSSGERLSILPNRLQSHSPEWS